MICHSNDHAYSQETCGIRFRTRILPGGHCGDGIGNVEGNVSELKTISIGNGCGGFKEEVARDQV